MVEYEREQCLSPGKETVSVPFNTNQCSVCVSYVCIDAYMTQIHIHTSVYVCVRVRVSVYASARNRCLLAVVEDGEVTADVADVWLRSFTQDTQWKDISRLIDGK